MGGGQAAGGGGMTPQNRARGTLKDGMRMEAKLLNAAPGGAIAAARDFGIDLSLLVERLRRTPEERLRDLQQVMTFHEQIRGAARASYDPARKSSHRTRPA